MTEDPTTGRWLRGLLQDAGDADGEEGEHLADEELAAYLDRRLAVAQRRRLEDHLASCSTCRALAREAALALGHPAVMATGGAIGARHRGLAVAASVAVVVAGGWWVANQRREAPAVGLSEVGVTAEELAAAGSAVAAHAGAALAGSLELLPALAVLGPGPELEAMRGAATEARPECLDPRWSAVRGRRPTLTWRRPESAARTEGYEVLVVDRRERVVGAWQGSVSPGVDVVLTDWSAPALTAGEVYGWRVSVEGEGGWTASTFAPFVVLDAARIERLEAELGRAGGDPFLRASVLAAHGLLDDSMGELARLAEVGGADDRRLRDTARALLGLQRMAPSELERELARRLEIERQRGDR